VEAGKVGSCLPEVVVQGSKKNLRCFLPKLARVMGQRNGVLKLQKATMKTMCKCHSETGKETVKLPIVKLC